MQKQAQRWLSTRGGDEPGFSHRQAGSRPRAFSPCAIWPLCRPGAARGHLVLRGNSLLDSGPVTEEGRFRRNWVRAPESSHAWCSPPLNFSARWRNIFAVAGLRRAFVTWTESEKHGLWTLMNLKWPGGHRGKGGSEGSMSVSTVSDGDLDPRGLTLSWPLPSSCRGVLRLRDSSHGPISTQETHLSWVICRNLLLLDSIILFSNHIPYSIKRFWGWQVKGDIFKAISCLRSEDIENFDDALLKGTLLSQNRLGKGKPSTLSLSGHKLQFSDGFFLEFNLVLEAKLIAGRF